MYLDQVPLNTKNIKDLLRKHLINQMEGLEDQDDQIVEVLETPERIKITTETGCVFHVTVEKIH